MRFCLFYICLTFRFICIGEMLKHKLKRHQCKYGIKKLKIFGFTKGYALNFGFIFDAD